MRTRADARVAGRPSVRPRGRRISDGVFHTSAVKFADRPAHAWRACGQHGNACARSRARCGETVNAAVGSSRTSQGLRPFRGETSCIACQSRHIDIDLGKRPAPFHSGVGDAEDIGHVCRQVVAYVGLGVSACTRGQRLWWRQWSVHVSADSTVLRFVGTRRATASGGTDSADSANDADDADDADAAVHLHDGSVRGAGSGCRCCAGGTRRSCRCHVDTLCRLRRMCSVPSHRHHH